MFQHVHLTVHGVLWFAEVLHLILCDHSRKNSEACCGKANDRKRDLSAAACQYNRNVTLAIQKRDQFIRDLFFFWTWNLPLINFCHLTPWTERLGCVYTSMCTTTPAERENGFSSKMIAKTSCHLLLGCRIWIFWLDWDRKTSYFKNW